MKFILSIIFSFIASSSVFSSDSTYTVTDQMLPTDLRIELVLNTPIMLKSSFTRYLTFKNIKNKSLSIPIEFSQTSILKYDGKITAAGLVTLQSMAQPNYRSYWDKMYFENKGDAGSLNIKTIKGYIRYDQTCCDREQEAMIIYNQNVTLSATIDSKPLSHSTGRMAHAMNYLGISYSELSSYPEALQDFINDIGKSGSSDSSDSTSSSNPKYGLEKSLCSETVSWYYYEHGIKITDESNSSTVYDFKDITFHKTMADQFQAAGRLYCYHSGRAAFIKWTPDNDWDYSDEYIPQPGDYLDRKDSDTTDDSDDGHAMMMVRWDASTGVATVLDGPWNINFLPVKIREKEESGSYDFCVGRIPEND